MFWSLLAAFRLAGAAADWMLWRFGGAWRIEMSPRGPAAWPVC